LLENPIDMRKIDADSVDDCTDMSEKDPALRVMKAVADYYSLHRNLRLDFVNGKLKKAVEHLVSVIRPATLKALIESKLEMDKSQLKKDFTRVR
jgi:hypothetical protein